MLVMPHHIKDVHVCTCLRYTTCRNSEVEAKPHASIKMSPMLKTKTIQRKYYTYAMRDSEKYK